jgi:hypothetical protein
VLNTWGHAHLSNKDAKNRHPNANLRFKFGRQKWLSTQTLRAGCKDRLRVQSAQELCEAILEELHQMASQHPRWPLWSLLVVGLVAQASVAMNTPMWKSRSIYQVRPFKSRKSKSCAFWLRPTCGPADRSILSITICFSALIFHPNIAFYNLKLHGYDRDEFLAVFRPAPLAWHLSMLKQCFSYMKLVWRHYSVYFVLISFLLSPR